MRRRSFLVLTTAALATAAATVLGAGSGPAPAAAGPPKPPPIVTSPVTIYSDTFTPLKRFPDGDSLQLKRFYSGPGQAPNLFTQAYGTDGEDAFFNTPDITIGATPLSVVSADVCAQVTGAYAYLVAITGVQDLARDVAMAYDQDDPTAQGLEFTDGAMACRTLVFTPPVKLVDHPHLVTAVIQYLPVGTQAVVDGVTYHLRPTQSGDVEPTAPFSSSRFSALLAR